MPARVHKEAAVLDLFSVERPGWGPTEVADALGIAKATAHALLGELTSVGLTERLPCGRYRLGWRTLELARTKLATMGMILHDWNLERKMHLIRAASDAQCRNRVQGGLVAM